jgi:hypothetical protein
MLVENWNRDAGNELGCPLGHPVEIARDHEPAPRREPRHPDRRILIDVVDVQHAGGRQVYRLARQAEADVAVPQDHPFTGALVDQDDGKLVVGVEHDDAGQIDAPPDQFVADQLCVRIRPHRSEVGGAQAEGGARGKHRGHLSAA